MAKADPYPECFLGSVVSPGEYWLVSRLRSHVKEVKMLEEMLSEDMNQILTLPDPELLVPQSCVAVEIATAKGNWQRGKIIAIFGEGVYKVFLVDCGNFINVEIRHLQLIQDKKYLEVEPLAFKLQLYGLVPCIVMHDLKKRICENWSLSAEEFVRNLFSQRVHLYVKKVYLIKRIIFGDIYLIDQPNGPLYSLGKLLCDKEYGVYAELHYKKKVMEVYLSNTDKNVGNDSLDLTCGPHIETPRENITTKLERAQEWQFPVAQNQKICHEFGPCVLKSPSDGISDSINITDLDLETEKTVVGVDIRKDSCKKEVPKEAVKNPEDNCSGNVRTTMTGSKTLENDTVGTFGLNIHSGSVSPEKKKEFSIILEENFKVYPPAENDYSIGIFTWFSDSIVQPVNKFRNLNISPNIILNLEKEGNFKSLSPIQRWAIPSIQRGHNVVIIGNAKTGKTLSYLIPLLAILQDRLNEKQIAIGNGPVAVILCSGSRSCNIIYYICHTLLRRHSEKEEARAVVRVRVAYGSSREKRSWVQLTNGCELLISTPHCLARLLKHRGITNLERLDYLVMDEVDAIIQEPFLSPMKIILYQSKLSRDCQRVFCGEKWTPELDIFVNMCTKSRAILIGSYLEAAVYAKLKPHVFLVDKEKKSEIVLDAILPQVGKSKILIACECTSDVMLLGNALKNRGYSPLVAHSDMVIHDVKALEQVWKSATIAPIMICCDDVIHRLSIDDAEMLVHYSLPPESKTNFGKRFSTVIRSCGMDSPQDAFRKELNVLLLIDDQNHYQLPHIVDFVIRLGGKIPEKISELSREISWRVEAIKKDVPLCSNLLEFGDCINMKKCRMRHVFVNEIDSSDISFPVHLVKFAVLEVHTVCHWSVRFIEMIDKTGKKAFFENYSEKISENMRKFYELEENRTIVGKVEISKLYAVERQDSNAKRFERGTVIEFKKFNELNKVSEVLVKFVDNGQIARVSVYKLYELPEYLMKYIPQAMDIFLCDLLPNDFERAWSEEAVFSAKSYFTKPLKESQFWIGKVRLALKNSFHLESVKLCRFLDNVKTHVVDCSARRKLLTQGVAVENAEHFEKLRLLCQKGNIKMHCYKDEECELYENTVEPQWAFLDGDLPEVEFVSAESTSCLFVRLAKFRNLLTKLETECQKVGEEMKMSWNSKKRADSWTLKAGMYCLALFENSWNRGKIQYITDDRVLVFFIDYGDFHYIQDLLPIPNTLLTQLPAQAIECCLVGLKGDITCSESVLNEIYSFSNEGVDYLYVSVISKSEDSQMTGGWKYCVNVVNAGGVSLNRKLVEANLVEADENSFHLAENIKIDVFDSDDDTDVSKTSGDERVESTPEGDEIKLADVQDLPCIGDISDDENAVLMVEEFMEQFFSGSVTKKDNMDSKKSVAGDGKLPGVATQKSEDCSRKNENEVSRTNNKCGEETREVVSSHTPQILWCQDHNQLQIKFVLNNVNRYKLSCTTTHFLFRCFLDGKLYVAGLRMFGSVNPHLTKVRVKPFYVEMIMAKLCPLQWPRLTMDKHKCWWIKFDVDYFDCEPESYVAGICRKALEEMECGLEKRSSAGRDIKPVSSTDSDDSSDSDSDIENIYSLY